jgi:ferredoxin
VTASDVPAYTVTLEWSDGRTERVETAADQTVLDAAEASSVGLPYGCLYGACGTCTARVLDGGIRHRKPPKALKERHLEAGYVLLCVATPTSDCTLRVGADVQAELVPNPWK